MQATFELHQHRGALHIECVTSGAVELVAGRAHAFGYSLLRKRPLHFEKKTIVISPHYWAIIRVSGEFYAHIVLDFLVQTYEPLISTFSYSVPRRGTPTILVVGPSNSGKSTLCQYFVNTSLKRSRQVVYADVDVGQNSLGISGSVHFALLQNLIWDERSIPHDTIGSYFFGHNHVRGRTVREYFNICTNLAAKIARFRRNNTDLNLIVNTMGWIEGLGYDIVTTLIKIFSINVIVVIDAPEVCHRLELDHFKEITGNYLRIFSFPKAPSTYYRDQSTRTNTRERKIDECFNPRVILKLPVYHIRFKCCSCKRDTALGLACDCNFTLYHFIGSIGALISPNSFTSRVHAYVALMSIDNEENLVYLASTVKILTGLHPHQILLSAHLKMPKVSH